MRSLNSLLIVIENNNKKKLPPMDSFSWSSNSCKWYNKDRTNLFNWKCYIGIIWHNQNKRGVLCDATKGLQTAMLCKFLSFKLILFLPPSLTFFFFTFSECAGQLPPVSTLYSSSPVPSACPDEITQGGEEKKKGGRVKEKERAASLGRLEVCQLFHLLCVRFTHFIM